MSGRTVSKAQYDVPLSTKRSHISTLSHTLLFTSASAYLFPSLSVLEDVDVSASRILVGGAAEKGVVFLRVSFRSNVGSYTCVPESGSSIVLSSCTLHLLTPPLASSPPTFT